MRQIIYVSTATAQYQAPDAAAILDASRRNNGRAGVTGLLYSDGKRFLQVLEGELPEVAAAYARIECDPRHRALVILSDRLVGRREFGDWAMAHRAPGTDGDRFILRVADMVATASPEVRATFTGFAEVRRAA